VAPINDPVDATGPTAFDIETKPMRGGCRRTVSLLTSRAVPPRYKRPATI
jgi:hypothetical protein